MFWEPRHDGEGRGSRVCDQGCEHEDNASVLAVLSGWAKGKEYHQSKSNQLLLTRSILLLAPFALDRTNMLRLGPMCLRCVRAIDVLSLMVAIIVVEANIQSRMGPCLGTFDVGFLQSQC